MVLKANKHCLLEKPFACSYEDAKYLAFLAKERNLFCMEGMWTRFFPAVEKARSLALGSSDGSEKVVIGVVVQVHSDFNFLPLQGFWNMLKYYDSTATIWDAMMIVFRRTKRPSRQPTSCIKS